MKTITTLSLMALGVTPMLSSAQVIRVVNMTPNAMSNETNQDSETNIAVDPADFSKIVGTAFTPDPLGTNAPVYFSSNEGSTWSLKNIFPFNTSFGTYDNTVKYGTTSHNLYFGVINGSVNEQIYRNTSPTLASVLTALVTRGFVDQPWTTAMRRWWETADHVFVGGNNLSGAPNPVTQSALVDYSTDGETAVPVFTQKVIDNLAGGGSQDNPQIRSTHHLNGTTYTAYINWLNSSISADIVVVKDTGNGLFNALGGTSGVVAKANVPFTFNFMVGNQRTASYLALAVDPRDSNHVYMVYGDISSGVYRLHLIESTNGAVSWGPDLLLLNNAVNAAIAVNSRGVLGLSYQLLVGSTTWETHFRRRVGGVFVSDYILNSFLQSEAPFSFSPFMGDYHDLMAVGKNFYGTFAASGNPNPANFPNGRTFQRNFNAGNNHLRNLTNTADVPYSIDPYFYKIEEKSAGDDFFVRDWTETPAIFDTGIEPSVRGDMWSTSDVWNRAVNTSGAPNANDWYPTDPGQASSGGLPKNWIFSRIRRNSGGPAATVQAKYFYADWGAGANFVNCSATPDMVNFAAGATGPIVTPGNNWVLPGTVSAHVCIAVELSEANDPYSGISLLGTAPGAISMWDDNNRAQRNLSVVYVLTPGPVSPGPKTKFALIHNPTLVPKQLEVRATTGTRRVVLTNLTADGAKPTEVQNGLGVMLPVLQPGEFKMVRLDFQHGDTPDLITVRVLDQGVDMNGFTLGVQVAGDKVVLPARLETHAALLVRADAMKLWKDDGSIARLQELAAGGVSPDVYAETVKSQMENLQVLVRWALQYPDINGIDALYTQLVKALDSGDVVAITGAHDSLLSALDTKLTTQWYADHGTPADIRQTVRLHLARSKAESEVLTGYENRLAAGEADFNDYPTVLRKWVEEQGVDAISENLYGKNLLNTIAQTSDLGELQKAHMLFVTAI